MSAPRVSVVMSVWNGERDLAATLESVLSQEGCDFEFIVVDDGSSDGTASILQAYAQRDARLRVLSQTNTGLTRALARGCSLAQGDYIARQDCGDLSLPGRLQRQALLLDANPDVVLTACATRTVGPKGELLYVAVRDGQALDDGLRAVDAARYCGPPHHGATMFRRSAYVAVGGYRLPFVVAQDMDLWLRLCEQGRCVGDAVEGYQARLDAAGISSQRRADQLATARLALACAHARRAGESESALLAKRQLPVQPRRRNARLQRARFFYFVGSCLRLRDPAAAREYFWLAFREHPLLLRNLVRLALG